MNWLNASAPKAQRNHLPLIGCLLLACVVPIILCQKQDKPLRDERRNAIGSGDILLRQSKIRWTQHEKELRHLSEPTLKMKSHIVQRRHREGSQKSPKAQLKRKKQIRDRKKFHKDSEKYLKDPKQSHINLVESEKKYFDYFPIEDTNKKLVPLKDEEVEVVLLSNDTFIKEKILKGLEKPGKEHKSKRSKRAVPHPEIYPQQNYNYVRSFLASEQRSQPPGIEFTNRIPQVEQYYSQGTHNDPWNNRFTQPSNGFYLPVPRPFVPASVPHIKYPIPGIYYNAISPSGGRPVLTPSRPSVDNRFGAEDDRVIWEIKFATGGNTVRSTTVRPPTFAGGFGAPTDSNIPGIQTRPPIQTTRPPASPGTRRPPPPPLIHSENRGRRTTTQPPRSVPSNSIPQRADAPRPTLRTTAAPPSNPVEPSRCVWAIVSCCSRNDLNVRYNCFEQIGCHGAFWDYNPCADNFQDAALSDAQNFFKS